MVCYANFKSVIVRRPNGERMTTQSKLNTSDIFLFTIRAPGTNPPPNKIISI